MVNFGGHLKVVRSGDNLAPDLYLVPYNDIKQIILASSNGSAFCTAWKESFQRACQDLSRALDEFWTTIFQGIAANSDPSLVRGAPRAAAVELYWQQAGPEAAQALLRRLAQIHTAALTNDEALRKLAKKWDKQHPPPQQQQEPLVSVQLLPSLYSSILLGGQAVLEECMGLLRHLLNNNSNKNETDEDSDHYFKALTRHDSEQAHQKSVAIRMSELHWLQRLLQSIPTEMIPSLVAHRGFHHTKDRNDKRPLENSLAAYETAWTSGLHLCECDIALTKDEKLVLAHDTDFSRLALNATHDNSTKRVADLTLQQLMGLPLKCGTRPPLLIDVLRSAHAISAHAKLIIEIKPGNAAAASALARLLLRHADLAARVEMVMSFDAVTMHRLRAELAAATSGGGGALGGHHRLLSFDHVGTLMHHPSFSGPIGLCLSQTDLVNHAGVDNNDDHHVVQEHPSWFPKLMLLTVSQKPKIPCELQVGVENLSPIDGWVTTADGAALDGVYLQYQPAMKTAKGAAALRALSERFAVGVWGFANRDPDDWETFSFLVNQAHVRYVNTDLPTNFRPDLMVRANK